MTTTKQWAKQITIAWQKSIDGIFECGRLLIAAKTKLKHGEFQKMIEHELPFKPRTAEMLMSIAANARLAKHASLLPASWYTLYLLSRLSDAVFDAALADGRINPDMERDDVPIEVPTIEAQPETVVSVDTVAAPARAVTVHSYKTETPSYWSDAKADAEDRAERVIDALELLAADPAVADDVIEILCDDGERLARVLEGIQAISRIEAALRSRLS